eukprot:scaffold161261_cov64-Cyclotella_meneghiniana.AAC.3
MLALQLLIPSSAIFASHSRTMTALRSFKSSASSSELSDEAPTIAALLNRSQKLRQQLYGTSSNNNESLPSFLSDTAQLAYPSSSYMMKPDARVQASSKFAKTVKRGYCNWLLPHRIMIGQYPGMTPESNGPTQNECMDHIENMVRDAKISLFCCLQSEVPCQSDNVGWTEENKVYLEPYYRREFPRPFTRYGTIAQELAGDGTIEFVHNPIEDLSVPTCNNSLLNLLSRLIHHLEEEEEANTDNNGKSKNAIYIHCWGGRGRAGLIGSCLISLLFPELSPNEVLEFVQNAYSTRAGADSMPRDLRRSPQTEQ